MGNNNRHPMKKRQWCTWQMMVDEQLGGYTNGFIVYTNHTLYTKCPNPSRKLVCFQVYISLFQPNSWLCYKINNNLLKGPTCADRCGLTFICRILSSICRIYSQLFIGIAHPSPCIWGGTMSNWQELLMVTCGNHCFNPPSKVHVCPGL